MWTWTKTAGICGLALLVCSCTAEAPKQERPQRKVKGLPRYLSGPSQPMPDQLMLADAPKTARQVGCFRGFTQKTTMAEVVRKCGVPDEHHGSGLYLFLYDMDDGSLVVLGTGSLDALGYVSHVTPGGGEALMEADGALRDAEHPPEQVQPEYQQHLAEKCRPKVVQQGKTAEKVEFRGQVRHNDPVVAFRIQESGEVTGVALERSSGVNDIDAQALAWTKGARFNSRPGCGVVESKMSVTIDFC